MKILVVDCLTAGKGKRKFTRDFIGAGPRYIAGFIEFISKKQFTTKISRIEDILEGKIQNLHDFPIICLSAMTMDQKAVIKALKIWKSRFSDEFSTLSIIGGPIMSECNVLYQIPVDLGIFGEGESALYSLFCDNSTELNHFLSKLNQNSSWKYKLFEQISGIIYLSAKNKLVENKIEKPEKNWFKKSPGYPHKILEYAQFKNSRIYVECLRGCSNFRRTALKISNNRHCNNNPCTLCRSKDFVPKATCPESIPPGCGFCSTIHSFGPPRSREISLIIKEIQELILLGSHRIVLGGPDFLDFHREKLIETKLINPRYPEPNYSALNLLIEQLLTISPIKHHKVQLFIENIKATLCTEHALSILAKIPKAIFSIGCETGSSEFANILGRPGDPNEVYNVVKLAHKYNIRVHVYFIHSLPGDTLEYATKTLEFMKKLAKLNVEKITLYSYRELPGSPFYKINKQYTKFSKAIEKKYTKIKRFVINYNRIQKEHMLNKSYRVFLSEKNSRYPTDAIGWILEGGPKVSVRNGVKYMKTFQKVKITKVLSDRLVLGEII